jgi:uncharacterized membrane protein (UPF0127 family)
MKKTFVLMSALVLFTLLAVAIYFFEKNHLSVLKANPSAIIKDHVFSIDIAKTPHDKESGLSIKNSIGENYGMYFPFETADYYAFWMKNMKFPIDIIFLRDNRVVSIFSNIQPPLSNSDKTPVYQTKEKANAALEIAAGLSQKLGLKKGDAISFQNLPQ